MATGWWRRMLAGLGLALLATGAGAAPVGPDLPRLAPCLRDGTPACGTALAGADPAGALDGRLGIETAHLPAVDPVSALLPRASRAVVADLTGRFRHIARVEAFLAFVAAGALSADDPGPGDPLLAAVLPPLGTRAIAAFPGQSGGLFAVVGGQILRSPDRSGTPGRRVAATRFEASPAFFLSALAGGAGGNGGGMAATGGTSPAARSAGGAMPGLAPDPLTVIAAGVPAGTAPGAATGPDGSPGIGPDGGPDGGPNGGQIGGPDGGPGPLAGGGGGGSPDSGPDPDPGPDPGPDPDPDPGPAPVPLPLPGLLLACALCGLFRGRPRSN